MDDNYFESIDSPDVLDGLVLGSPSRPVDVLVLGGKVARIQVEAKSVAGSRGVWATRVNTTLPLGPSSGFGMIQV